MTINEIKTKIRTDYMENIRAYIESQDEEVLQVASNKLTIPWVFEDEEGYITLTFSIPKGSHEGGGYDGHHEADCYAEEVVAKEEKRKQKEAEKQKKIARDKKRREEAKEG